MSGRVNRLRTASAVLLLAMVPSLLAALGTRRQDDRHDHRGEEDLPLVLGPPPVEAAHLAPGEVVVEYIAHACFRLFGPDGTVLLIDPYADRVWLNYDLPITALVDPLDAILITHPHYDHDAGRFIGRPFPFPATVPVYTDIGAQRAGEFSILGVGGKHARNYGREFGQINTIFVIEVDGLRIAHVGDNGPLAPPALSRIGAIDVLMLPIDGEEHLLTSAEVAEMIRVVAPRIVVPMHYAHPDLGGAGGLGPIDPWLEGRDDVTRLAGNVDTWSKSSLPDTREVRVFEHSPLVASSLATAAATMTLPATASATPVPSATPTHTLQPTATATASTTPVGHVGWRALVGDVQGRLAGTTLPLASAHVTCATTSDGMQPRACVPQSVTTGPDGTFAFDLLLDEADVISIAVEREGFGPGARMIGGSECAARCPDVALVLAPWIFLPTMQR